MNKIKTRLCVATLSVIVSLGVAPAGAENPVDKIFGQTVTVYKTPSCGCCSAWVDYLEAHGFDVTSHDLQDLGPVKRRYGLDDPRLASCHTAIVGGYLIEGHVPVDDIRRLLSDRPAITGLTAPGMPQLSPGMMSEQPIGYDVLSFDEDGHVELFSRY